MGGVDSVMHTSKELELGEEKGIFICFFNCFWSFWLRGKIEGPGQARSLEAVSVLSWVRKCVGLGCHLR